MVGFIVQISLKDLAAEAKSGHLFAVNDGFVCLLNQHCDTVFFLRLEIFLEDQSFYDNNAIEVGIISSDTHYATISCSRIDKRKQYFFKIGFLHFVYTILAIISRYYNE